MTGYHQLHPVMHGHTHCDSSGSTAWPSIHRKWSYRCSTDYRLHVLIDPTPGCSTSSVCQLSLDTAQTIYQTSSLPVLWCAFLPRTPFCTAHTVWCTYGYTTIQTSCNHKKASLM